MHFRLDTVIQARGMLRDLKKRKNTRATGRMSMAFRTEIPNGLPCLDTGMQKKHEPLGECFKLLILVPLGSQKYVF